MRKIFLLVSGVFLSVSLVGCSATRKTNQEVSPVGLVSEQSKPVDPVALKEQKLAEALEIYAEGRYEDAIATLSELTSAPELSLSSKVKVFKFMSFSYCALGRLPQCRQSFGQSFELDPTFQLTEAERGHPIWGKEFNAARAAFRKKNMKKDA